MQREGKPNAAPPLGVPGGGVGGLDCRLSGEKPVAMRGDHKSELIVHIMIES